jgi:hypothetical protein
MIFNIAEPKTQDAVRRQANCYHRALSMEAAGYTVELVSIESGDYYRVTSPAGDVYAADPMLGTCQCADFAKHGDTCKHLMFVNLWEGGKQN